MIDNPPGPTTYILTATNAGGKTTKDFSVDVKPPGATPVPPTPAPAPAPSRQPGPRDQAMSTTLSRDDSDQEDPVTLRIKLFGSLELERDGPAPGSLRQSQVRRVVRVSRAQSQGATHPRAPGRRLLGRLVRGARAPHPEYHAVAHQSRAGAAASAPPASAATCASRRSTSASTPPAACGWTSPNSKRAASWPSRPRGRPGSRSTRKPSTCIAATCWPTATRTGASSSASGCRVCTCAHSRN